MLSFKGMNRLPSREYLGRVRAALKSWSCSPDGSYSAMGTAVTCEELIANQRKWDLRFTVLQILQKPTDYLYFSSKCGDPQLLPTKVFSRILQELPASRAFREQILDLFRCSDGQLRLPVVGPYLRSGAIRPSGISCTGRSLIIAANPTGHGPCLVLKGAFTGTTPSQPFEFLPERMDFSRRPHSWRFLREPQPTWVARGTESQHAARSEVLNSLCLRATCTLSGLPHRMPLPVGVVRLDTIPVLSAEGKVRQVPAVEYTRSLAGALSRRGRQQLLRFLCLEGVLSLEELNDSRADTSPTLGPYTRKEDFLFTVLERWRPCIYMYYSSIPIAPRLEEWDIRPEMEFRKITRPTLYDIRRDLGVSLSSVDERRQKLLEFAAYLGAVTGLWHGLGGDFGTSKAALSPKDVTALGGLFDLHSNRLPTRSNIIYRIAIGPLKRMWNRRNAEASIRAMRAALELRSTETRTAQLLFKERYRLSRANARKHT